MGVDVGVLDFLLQFKGEIGPAVLQLGRQGFHVPRSSSDPRRVAAEKVLCKYDPQTNLEDLLSEDGFTEKLFKYLGGVDVYSMDASPFEGASLIHALNDPIPESLNERFDTIFDGGTIEHVFDVKQVFDSVKKMLKMGGIILSVNAANNQLGHGFYQFSPELMWRVFSPEAGFQVLKMQILPVGLDPQPWDAIDPLKARARVEIGRTPGPAYIVVAAKKLVSFRKDIKPQQSDYSAAWKRSQR